MPSSIAAGKATPGKQTRIPHPARTPACSQHRLFSGRLRGEKASFELMQVELQQDLLQAFARVPARRAGQGGDDELVLQRVLPADQFGDGDLVAVRLQLQAAQHVVELAAELAVVDRGGPY